jgi:HPt (histidine-containing phosphotransfer) domain-containing protein
MSLPATNAAENGALTAYPRELLIDHDYLYELERELGPEKITDRMVAALDRILDLQREMEAARSGRNADALAAHFAAIQKEAGESGLPAIAGLAQEMAQAIGRGLPENGLPDVQRLQHKIAATRHALGLAFPRLGS